MAVNEDTRSKTLYSSWNSLPESKSCCF